MERIMRWARAATFVVLLGATCALGFVVWRQALQLQELRGVPASPRAASASTDGSPRAGGWVSIEGHGMEPRCIGLEAGELATANLIALGAGAGRDGATYRITVVPRTPRPDRLVPWRNGGRDVVEVDGREAITYLRDPRTWSADFDFALMSGDRIIVAPEPETANAIAGATDRDLLTPDNWPPILIDGAVRREGVYEGRANLRLAQLLTLAGGYTGASGSLVEVRIQPRRHRLERAQQWLRGGGQVEDTNGRPVLVCRGDPSDLAYWQQAPSIEPGDEIRVIACY